MMGPNYTQEQVDDLIARFLSGNISTEEQAALIREGMMGAADLAVPLEVDVGIGETWKDAKG